VQLLGTGYNYASAAPPPSPMLLLPIAHTLTAPSPTVGEPALLPCVAPLFCPPLATPTEPLLLATIPPRPAPHPALLSPAATPPRPLWYCVTAPLLFLPALQLLQLLRLVWSCPSFQQSWAGGAPSPVCSLPEVPLHTREWGWLLSAVFACTFVSFPTSHCI
jgi:hypothetical protein